MNCEICEKQSGPVHFTNVPQNLNKTFTYMCIDCTKKKGLFCDKHQTLRMGFLDNTVLCIPCVEEIIASFDPCEREDIYASIRKALPPCEQHGLDELVDRGATFTQSRESVVMLRYVVSAAMRAGMTVQEMVHRITTKRTIKFILWGWSSL